MTDSEILSSREEQDDDFGITDEEEEEEELEQLLQQKQQEEQPLSQATTVEPVSKPKEKTAENEQKSLLVQAVATKLLNDYTGTPEEKEERNLKFTK